MDVTKKTRKTYTEAVARGSSQPYEHWGSSHEGSGRHPRQHGGDAVAASENLPQILTVSVRYCGPAFVCLLSMLWDTLTWNPELQ